jgi:opacity protein-like surface antigen
MRIVKSITVGLALLACTPGIGSAQDRKIHFNIGGGPTFVGGEIGDRFATGWGPAIGVTVDANDRLAFQFEYAYRWFNFSDTLPLNATRFSANHQTQQLDFNLVATLTPPDSTIRAYITAGPGAYYREVEISEYVGSGIICDPWYYICGSYPVSEIIGSRGGWDFGFNAGGGVGFKLGEEAEFYIESRFHYVVGPDIQPSNTVPALTGGKSTGYYYPLTFGFRF